MKDNNSLAHGIANITWCLHQSTEGMEIYGQIRKDIGVIIRRLCEQNEIEIIEAELCPDHIHMLVSIPPKYSVASIMGYIKGKSSLMIFDRHANYKYKYGNRHFWCRGVNDKIRMYKKWKIKMYKKGHFIFYKLYNLFVILK